MTIQVNMLGLNLRRLNIYEMFKSWKRFVEQSLTDSSDQLNRLQSELRELRSEHSTLAAKHESLAANHETLRRVTKNIVMEKMCSTQDFGDEVFHDAGCCFARRGDRARIVNFARGVAAPDWIASQSAAAIVGAIAANEISGLEQATLSAEGKLTPWRPLPKLLAEIGKSPKYYADLLSAIEWRPAVSPGPISVARFYDDASAALAKCPDLIDFAAAGQANIAPGDSGTRSGIPLPFAFPDALPPFKVPAEPKRRSVLFTQNCYYNFFYLAKALRARGWDAVSLSAEPPDSPFEKFYHGEDLTIYDPDPVAHGAALARFISDNSDRFGIVHTYGVGILSLFASNHDKDRRHRSIPWDVLEWKRRGTLIGYSHSGCLDGVSQTSFRNWSPLMCTNCPWEDSPDVCSDEKNLAWGRKISSIVDLFCTETDPPFDFKGSQNAFRGPLTFALDPEVWRPGLEPPPHLKRARASDEVLVYHAVGNYETRRISGRNVKGTAAVLAAIETLQGEGISIRLDFVHDVPSTDNRYVQVQADIIVDQLNYGRYGALAREGMMLGKPVVGRMNKLEPGGRAATQCVIDSPIVNADENSVVDVLRKLALDSRLRSEIGEASRRHAIHWWSAERLAKRFELVYDHVREHGRSPSDEDVP